MGGLLAFLGGFLAVALCVFLLVSAVKKKLRRFTRQAFGTADLGKVVSMMELESDEQPKSISACDSILLPRILKDFPDFDPGRGKELIRAYLEEQLGSHECYRLHRIGIAAYEPTAVQKTIVYQAAVEWREQGKKVQKRYCLRYSYIIDGGDQTVAANCPNCGSPLDYGQQTCIYCGSRVSHALGNVWKVTELREG